MARLLAGFSLLLVSLGGVEAGAQSPVTWSVTVGFESLYRENSWTPLTVEISNTGPDLRGNLFVPVSATSSYSSNSHGGTYGKRPAAVNYTIPLNLPTQSHKRYVLCVPSSSLDSVYFGLGQRPIKHELSGLTALDERALFAVVIGGDGNALRAVHGSALPAGFAWSSAGPSSGSGARLQIGHVPWNSLPDNWLAWDGVDAVVLADANVGTAAAENAEALVQWVKQGGTLFVPGGAVAPALVGSALEPLLPLQVTATEAALDVNALAVWCGASTPLPPGGVLLTRGTLRPGARVVAGTAAQPLVVQWSVGQGKVVLSALDYTGQPCKYWSGQEKLWQQLLGLSSRSRGHHAWDIYSKRLSELAGHSPQSAPPCLALVISFLVVYLLALAPGQYLALRKLDRRELSWIVTPAIVLTFTLGAYGLTLHTRGSATLLQRVSVICADPGATTGRGMGGVGLFSPRTGRYEFALGQGVAGARMDESQSSGTVTIEGGPQPTIRGFGVNMWSSRTFRVECTADLGQGIQVQEAEWDGKKLLVKVRNGSRLDFKDALIAGPNCMQSLGHLKPGATLGGSLLDGQVVFLPKPKPGTPEHLGSLLLEQMVYGSGGVGASGGLVPPSPAYYPPGYTGPALSSLSGGTYFVGITYDKVLAVDLRRHGARESDVSLVMVPLQPRLKPHASLPVPHWLVTGTVLSVVKQPPPGHSFDTRLRFSFDGAPPDSKLVKLSLLSVRLRDKPRVTQLKLLNQKTGQWNILPETQPRVWQVPHPQQYRDAAGNVTAACTVDMDNGVMSPLKAEATIITP